MQRVIDISEEMLEWVNDVNKFYIEYGIGDFIDVIKNGTPIPDNATNGDVIKAIFPNIDFTEMAITVHATTKVTSNGVKGGISYDFWKDWWNSLYQKGGKE